MRHSIFCFLLFLLLGACRKDDPPAPGGPEATWEQRFGGARDDWAFDVAVDEANQLFVLGRYFSATEAMYLLKLDAGGRLLWEKPAGPWDRSEGYALLRRPDGTLIAVGRLSQNNRSDLVVVALNEEGELQWSHIHDQRLHDQGHAACLTGDGHLAVAGYTQEQGEPRDLLVLLLDAGGAFLWSRVLPAGSYDGECAIAAAADGGVLVAGAALTGPDGVDTRLYRLDADGNTLWSNDWHKPGFQAPEALHPLGNGSEFFLVTRDEAEPGSRTYRVTADGRPGQPRATLAGTCRGARPTVDGGFLLTGFQQSPPPAFGVELFLARLDAQGQLLWERTYSSPVNRIGENAVETPDGRLVTVGYESTPENLRDMYVLKVARDGEQ